MKLKIYLIALILASLIFPSCKKYLDVKPDKSTIVPDKLHDFQALLDNATTLNTATGHLLGEISGDNYYLLKTTWQALGSAYERNAYVWKEEIFEGAESSDWNNPSLVVFYANIALEGIGKITPAAQETEIWNNIKGSALFFRAYAQYQHAQLFCKTYIQSSASIDKGIPLRLESDITVKTTRGTVEQTYHQILKDVKEAAELLPVTTIAKTRPSRPAAYALLARTYLQMQDYENALQYALLSLNDYSVLIDYKSLDAQASFPFSRFNDEIVFHSHTISASILNPSRLTVVSELYDSYDKDDLRKSCYYRVDVNGYVRFKGSYYGSNAFFTGITTAEVVLIQAECQARLGLETAAVNSINHLLKHRYKKDSFTSILFNYSEELINAILKERRKELVFRGIRWPDLKRLNLNEKTAVILQRVWNNEVITLDPNSPKYVFPIPEAVIKITGIEQNIR